MVTLVGQILSISPPPLCNPAARTLDLGWPAAVVEEGGGGEAVLPLCKHGSSSRPLPQWLQPCQASKAKTTSTGTTMPSCHQLLCRISSYELWILDWIPALATIL